MHGLRNDRPKGQLINLFSLRSNFLVSALTGDGSRDNKTPNENMFRFSHKTIFSSDE